MRAGRLKTRRYKVRKSGRGWVILALIGAVILGGAYYFRPGESPVLMRPAPTLTPQESAGDQRTITLPSQCWYALQLGVFDREISAVSLAESFRGRGAGGYVAGSAPYRVLAAAYESRSDAQKVQNQLRALHDVEVYVHEIVTGEIVIKASGQRAQLTALEDAYDALGQAAGKLSNLSKGLDQHAMEEESVRIALDSERETLSSLAQRLQMLFGENAHEAVKEIQKMLFELSEQLSYALAAQSELQLGAQIKYCQLYCIDALAKYAALLAQ